MKIDYLIDIFDKLTAVTGPYREKPPPVHGEKQNEITRKQP